MPENCKISCFPFAFSNSENSSTEAEIEAESKWTT